MENEKTLILQIKYGGLGDHLFYSHIPRIAKETGAYEKVYISNLSEFRHPDYKKLVWHKNPHVDGFVDGTGIEAEPVKITLGENILDAVMLGLGLDDGKRFHEPELYFQPEIKKELTNKSVYDPNFVSFVGNFGSSDLQKWIEQNKIKIDCQMKLRDKNILLKKVSETLQSKSLEDFCSIIISCKELYCLTSGTATLASALKKPATCFYGAGQDKNFHHSKMHKYIFIPESFINKTQRKIITFVKNAKNYFKIA